MKIRLPMLLLGVMIILTNSTPCLALADENIDYMQQMIDYALIGDIENGRIAEQARYEKLEGLEFPEEYPVVEFDTLYYTSKIITAEAGDVSEEIQRGVGEVFLNRIDSPEFPDSPYEVLIQPGQYYGKNNNWFNNLLPKETAILISKDLLEGNRTFPSSVIFQDNTPHGTGVYLKLWSGYSWMYYSYANNMKYYQTC